MVVEQKRVKISSGGDWYNTIVTCDGTPLEVQDVQINVTADNLTTVTLILDSTQVQFDIQSASGDVEQGPPLLASRDTEGRDVLAAIRGVERATGKRLLVSDI